MDGSSCPLGALLGALCRLLRRSWALLGRSCSLLLPQTPKTSPPQSIFTRLGLQNVPPSTPKNLQKPWKGHQISRFSRFQRLTASGGLSGLIFTPSWATFGCSRGLLRPSWEHPGRLLASLGALLGALWRLLARSWALLARSCARPFPKVRRTKLQRAILGDVGSIWA